MKITDDEKRANKNAYMREYNARNREKKRAADKAYYEKNRERLIDYQKDYYQDNKEKVLTRLKGYKEIVNEIVAYARKGPCANCGNEFHPKAMELHHMDRSQKVIEVCGKSTPRSAIKELLKCTRLCGTCHRLADAGIIEAKETLWDLSRLEEIANG